MQRGNEWPGVYLGHIQKSIFEKEGKYGSHNNEIESFPRMGRNRVAHAGFVSTISGLLKLPAFDGGRIQLTSNKDSQDLSKRQSQRSAASLNSSEGLR
jgi:hypothetical protein